MYRLFRITGLLFIIGICFGCNRTSKEVILKNSKGEPLLVYFVSEKDGKKERVKEIMYYDNGNIRYEGNFKDEKPSGDWKYFYENGKLFAKTTFGNPNQNELWKFYDSTKTLMHPNAQIKVHLNEERNTPTVVSFQEGDLLYDYLFFDNFLPRTKGINRNMKKDGEWIFWFDNGNIQTKGFFKEGIQVGVQEVYHSNGKLYYKGNFDNGRRVGEWMFYDTNGTQVESQIFE